MKKAGWRFEEGNGYLWGFSQAATFEKEGVRLDLHWGLHAAHLPSWTLKRLEEEMWQSPELRDGVFQPSAESLLVFLALHAEGHNNRRSEWSRNVEACVRLVRSRERVWEIARRARVTGAIYRSLLQIPSGPYTPLLDGLWGRILWYSSWLGGGHFLPRSIRKRLPPASYSHLINRSRRTTKKWFLGLEFEIDRGVFMPQTFSEELVQASIKEMEGVQSPVVVDVGTGCGAFACAVAAARSDARVYGTDTTRRALRNARRLGVDVSLMRGTILLPVPQAIRCGDNPSDGNHEVDG